MSDPDTVAALRDLLERAEKGEIDGIAVVLVKGPHTGEWPRCATLYSGTGILTGVYAALGGLDELKRRIETELGAPDFLTSET